jgi:hypothetical protein
LTLKFKLANGAAITCHYSGTQNTYNASECSDGVAPGHQVETAEIELDPAGALSASVTLRKGGLSAAQIVAGRQSVAEQLQAGGDLQPLAVVPAADVFTSEFKAELAEIARRHPRVTPLLGARFAFIGGAPIRPGKGQAKPAVRSYSLTFFSYTHNKAVVATLRNRDVINASYQNIWPGPSKEETDRAIALARQDVRIPAGGRNLDAGALLAVTPVTGREGHRLFDVRFGMIRVPGTAEYFALVDLTTDTVVTVGRVQ